MPADFIDITLPSDNGSRLLNLIETLQQVKSESDRTKAKMDHNIASSDYTALESLWGLEAGEGVTVYNGLATLVAQLAHADITMLRTRLGRV